MLLILALAVAEPPAFIEELIQTDHDLPRYAEQYYHPLGRSPVVDVLLGDPMYSVRFADESSRQLRQAADSGSAAAVSEVAARMGAMPAGFKLEIDPVPLPGLSEAVGAEAANALEQAWAHYLEARRRAGAAVADVTEEQRAYLRSNPARWWFADEDLTNYRYLTCVTDDHEAIFRIAARVDIGAMAEAQWCLARAADIIVEAKQSGLFDQVAESNLPWRHEGDSGVFVVAGTDDDVHREDLDLMVDLGGDDWYLSNAGGARDGRVAALCVDLDGDDHYDGKFAPQGGGFLGAGALVDLAGDDDYQGGDYAQGGCFLGSGLLVDHAGEDAYRAHHGCQGSGSFGLGVLWDRSGDDIYHSSGMSLGNGGPQGVGVLLETAGDDVVACGVWRDTRYTDEYGHGLGASIGVRSWPWYSDSSFYGGLGFVDDAQGDDRYEALVGLGSAYTFGAGIFVNSDGDDDYFAFSDAMGGTIHLGAGIMIEQGGDDTYRALDSAVGVGGDRGTGFFFETAGDDRYYVNSHGIGTGRKPKALGLAVEFAGDDRYTFGGMSMNAVWRPSNPENWAWATFADLSGDDRYTPYENDQDEVDGLDRGNDRAWRFSHTSHGFDSETLADYRYEDLVADMPTDPRLEMPWRPWDGELEGSAYRRLIDDTWTDQALAALDAGPAETDSETGGDGAADLPEAPVRPWIDALRSGALDYDERRRAYECMDLIRFSSEGRFDWSLMLELLEDPAASPTDQLAYAGTWCVVDRTPGVVGVVEEDLRNDRIKSPYARQIIIRAIGRSGGPGASEALAERLANDEDLIARRRAAFHLGRIGGVEGLPALAEASGDASPLIRYSVCSGLRDSGMSEAIAVIEPMREDDNLFVRRAACTAALSLGDASAVDQLLAEMGTDSIDTGWNYGRNLFVTMSEYVGEDPLEAYETDLEAWRGWWSENRQSFNLEAAMEASAEKRAERLEKPTSSE